MIHPTFSIFTTFLTTLGDLLPLPLFVIIGSVIEEIISPIPATLILGLAGSMVAASGTGLIYLAILTILATAGKTFAAWATYWAGRILGRIVIKKWGHILGINLTNVIETSHQMEKYKKAWGWIFAMRALPLAPSAAVSVASGILYVHQRIFLTSTFLGYIVRNLLTAATGYYGLDLLLNWDKYTNDPLVLSLFIALAVITALFLAVLKYRKK